MHLPRTQALALAAPEDYMRRFTDEGTTMLAMLHAVAAHGIKLEYVGQLIAAFPTALNEEDGVPKKNLAVQHAVSHIAPIVEPLSQRELEVIR